MSRTLKLAVIPGDGIGPEVIAEAMKVLDVVAPSADLVIEKTQFSLGADRYLATGDVLSEEDLAAIASHEAILLGAVGGKPGDPRIPAGIIERGLLLKLRFSLDHYVNLRPTTIFPGVVSPLANPGDVDFVVVREGTEGPYVGNGGALRQGTEFEIANELSVNTAHGVERVVRYAFDLAAKRDRKKLTLVHKTNVLVNAGSLWSRIVDAVATEYPQVTVDYLHIDAATIFFVTDPARFDVIVTDGSAPDIAGQQKADPTAAILSVGLLLEHFGYDEAAARIDDAVAADLSERGPVTRRTSEIGDAIVARLSKK
jgi:3-isopropylmalate dehydrogenase